MTTTQLIYGYHLGFSLLFPHRLYRPRRLSNRLATSLQALTQPGCLYSGLYGWYGASGIENAYTTVSDANVNSNWHRYYVLHCARHSHPDCCCSPQTDTTHNGVRPKQRTISLLHGPGDRSAVPQRPRTQHVPHAHCSQRPIQFKRSIKHAIGQQAND